MKTPPLAVSCNPHMRRLLCACVAVVAVTSSMPGHALTADAQFHSPMIITDDDPSRVFSRSDGTFFVARNFNHFNSEDRGPLLKFNADGTLDTSFRMPSGYFHVNTVAFATDGDLFVAAQQIGRLGRSYSVLRLNSDGSIDPSFDASAVATEQINALAVQADGKLLVAGPFTKFAGQDRAGIARLHLNGLLDTSFEPITLDGDILSNIVIQPDGKIVVGGSFFSVNGQGVNAVVRLNANGTRDTTFSNSAPRSQLNGQQPIRGLALQPDGKLLLAGRFQGPQSTVAPLARVNTNGSLDLVIGARPRGAGGPLTPVGHHVVLLANGNIAAAGDRIYCFTPTGQPVAGFENASLYVANFASIAARADGAFFVAAPSTSGPLADIVRFLPTGTREDMDLGQFGVAVLAEKIDVRRDGKIWLASQYADLIDATPMNGVARLEADGSVDVGFNAEAVTGRRLLSGFALDADDKVLLFDYFASSSTAPTGYLRLNADDSIDSTFEWDSSGLEFSDAFAVPGGKYLVVHALSPRATISNTVIHQLLPNGSRDESFNFAIDFNQAGVSNTGEIYAGDNRPLAFYADGRFLMRYFDRTGNYHLRRFHADGTIDESFAEGTVPALQTSRTIEDITTGETYYGPFDVIRAPATALTDATLLPDGKILVTGMFAAYSGTPAPGIVRLHANGSVDTSFKPGAGAQWTTTAADETHIPRVDAAEPLDGGQLLITGDFEAFDGKPAPGIARLKSDGTVDDSFVPPVAVQPRYTGLVQPYVLTLPISQLVPQGGGAFLLTGNFALSGSTVVRSVIRLTGLAKTVPLNISTRLSVQTGDNAMIGGFIITGNAPKKLIVRALGTSLGQAGVSGALADPTLELRGADGLIASNDNWKDAQQSEIEASGVAPQSELESAIVRTLAPGAYTAIVRGNEGGTGVGLVELYDLDQTVDSKLANISTRGFVLTGDNVMIGGFILGGSQGETNILVRALGPSLGDAGVAGALRDPTLQLRDNNGQLVAENDNWKATQESAINATTIPPQRDEEAAILAALPPGPYTAVVRGKDATTGVGLVEVYNVQ